MTVRYKTGNQLPAMCLIRHGSPARASVDKFTVSILHMLQYGSAEGPPCVVENRNLLSHPDDITMGSISSG